jgi:hypothetical protein
MNRCFNDRAEAGMGSKCRACKRDRPNVGRWVYNPETDEYGFKNRWDPKVEVDLARPDEDERGVMEGE